MELVINDAPKCLDLTGGVLMFAEQCSEQEYLLGVIVSVIEGMVALIIVVDDGGLVSQLVEVLDLYQVRHFLEQVVLETTHVPVSLDRHLVHFELDLVNLQLRLLAQQLLLEFTDWHFRHDELVLFQRYLVRS